MMKEKNKIILYGHLKELHNKHLDKKEDFDRVINKIKTYFKKTDCIIIKATKYNFFCLDKIIGFSEQLLKKKKSQETFSILPLQKLSKNFQKFVQKSNKLLQKYGVLILIDEELLELLLLLKKNANKYNENDLLRLLGIICETTFIGPKQLLIDVKNRCNTDCVYCWIHSPHIKKEMYNKDYYKKSKEIDFDTFKKVIDDAAKIKVEDIVLVGDGEPTIHKEFEKIISYINKRGLKTMLFSNGQFLNNSLIKTIVDCNVSSLNFSISSATNSVYKKIHPSVKKNGLTLIKNNLKKLIKYKHGREKKIPHITLLHVINKLNYKELPAMVKFAKEVGADEVTFQLIDLRDFSMHLKLSKKEIERVKKDIIIAKELAKKNNIIVRNHLDFQLENVNSDNGNWSEEVFTKRGCFIGWWFAYYRLDDVFTFCCSIKEVDKLKNNYFEKIWFSKDYEDFRVAGKYLSKNKSLEFKDGRKLFENKCDSCDNTGQINTVQNLIQEFQLEKFVFKKKNPKIILSMCPPFNSFIPPVSLNYLSSYLEKNKIEHKILDFNLKILKHINSNLKFLWNESEELFWKDNFFNKKGKELMQKEIIYCFDKIIKQNCKLVGFSVNNLNFSFTKEVVKKIKKHNPSIKILFGGSICDDEILVKSIPKNLVDYFIIGQAEEELVKLINNLSKKKKLKRIWKTETKINNIRTFSGISQQLETEDYDASCRLIQTSKGCVGNCSFCGDVNTAGEYQTKDPKSVFKEIEYYVNKKNIRHFIFADLLCNGNINYLENICDLIINSKLKISWDSFAMFRKEMNFSIFKKLKSSGCVMLNMGLESGSNRILKRMKKITNIKTAEKNLRNAKEAGVDIIISLIAGFPGETEKDFKSTMNFLERNKDFIKRIASINICYLKNSSALYHNPEKFGIISSKRSDWWLKWEDKFGSNFEIRKKRTLELYNKVNELGITFDKKYLYLLEEFTINNKYSLDPNLFRSEIISKSRNLLNKKKKVIKFILQEIKEPASRRRIISHIKEKGFYSSLLKAKNMMQDEQNRI